MKNSGWLFRVLPILFLLILWGNIKYFVIDDVSELTFSNILSLLLTLVVSGIYIYTERRSLTFLTADKLFFALFLFMIFPGILFLSKGKDRNVIVAVNAISLCLFLIATMIVKITNKANRISLTKLINSKLAKSPFENNVVLKSAVILSIISACIYVGSGNFNRSGALEVFTGLFLPSKVDDSISVNAYRAGIYESGGFASGFNLIIGNYIGGIIMPILGVFFVLEGRKRKSKLILRYGIAVLVLAMVFTVGTGSRLMTMKILLYLILCYSLLNTIDLKKIFKYGFLVLFMLILTTSLLGRGGTSVEGFGENVALNTAKSVERVFFIKGGSTLFVYDYYPYIEEFEYGKTMLVGLAGSNTKDAILAEKMYYYEYGKLGTAGPQTFGDFYANFGYTGQVVAAFLIGLIIASFSIFCLKKKKWNNFDLAFIAYMFLTFGYMGYSDSVSFKASGLHIVIILYLLYRFYKNLVVTKAGA